METEEQKNIGLAKEKEEKEKEEKEEREKEEEKEQEENERKEREEKGEAEAKAKVEAEAADAEAAAGARDTVFPVDSPKPTSNGLLPNTIPERPSPLSISTTINERPKRPVPGPLDLSSAQVNRSAAPPSALASARIIEDLNAVLYPDAIKTPDSDLNIAATPGKFRYDRDFLLQFMNVCKEKPDSLPPLEAIGLEPGEAVATPAYPGGACQGGRRLGSMSMSGAPSLQRQSSVGLGLGIVSQIARGGFSMGSFQTPASRLGDSQSRFEASSAGGRGGAGIPFPPGASGRLTPMTRSAISGGVGGRGGPRKTKHTKSQRGNNRGDSMRGSGFQASANQEMALLEPAALLEQSENHRMAGSTQRTSQQIEARALVERKVKSLLNKLRMEKFDSISDQIIEWANKSEEEKDGSTLMQVIKLVFERAKGEAAFSEMYARLCQKMMERVSPSVQDETIRNDDGQPIAGGLLFRKYLLNYCQEDFERGWSAKEAATALAASKAGDDKAAEAAGQASGEAVLYSEEYYAAAKAKRQGLGLVRFIGELFKLQMLTERIMHECIKKLLSNVVNPEEEEIESLCKLLTTVGQSLDNAKARNHMDIYFERMQEMARGSNINSRMQYMLQDVIELRARHWQARTAVAQPSIFAALHEQSKRDEAASCDAMEHNGSRRGEHCGDHRQQADGWNVAGGTSAARPPAKASDLSQFGKISKPTGISFGPSRVFTKEPKRDTSLSQASSNANMALGTVSGTIPSYSGSANQDDRQVDPMDMNSAPSLQRQGSLGFGSENLSKLPKGRSSMSDFQTSRSQLADINPQLEPSSIHGRDEQKIGHRADTDLLTDKFSKPQPAAKPCEDNNIGRHKSVDLDVRHISGDGALDRQFNLGSVLHCIKAYMCTENLDLAIASLLNLPDEYRHNFIENLVSIALDGGINSVRLAEKLLAVAHSQRICVPKIFERGLHLAVESAADNSIDIPRTYEWLARFMHASGMTKARVEMMAEKITVVGEPRLHPKYLLAYEFDKMLS